MIDTHETAASRCRAGSTEAPCFPVFLLLPFLIIKFLQRERCPGMEADGARPRGAPKASPGCAGDRGCSSGIPEPAAIASLEMPKNSPSPRAIPASAPQDVP